jgi:hypothetical protein
MSSLDDLRTTLHDHAHDADAVGLDTTTRTTRVHGRVRAVRRRRRTAGAVTAAVVLVLAGGMTFLQGARAPGPAGPDPVPEQLVGKPVPATIEAAGWTYAYVDSVTDEGSVEVTLTESDRPRLVAWAAEDGGWEVTQPDGLVYRAGPMDFSHYYWADAGLEGRLRLTGPGDAALAVYELADPSPPGLTVAGFTFRDRVGSDRLVAADAARGRSSLAMRFEVPKQPMRFGGLCTGTDDVAEMDVLVDGELVSEGLSCDGGPDPYFDPGALWFETWPEGPVSGTRTYAPGDVVGVEVRLVGNDGEPMAASPETVLAASFYEQVDVLPFEVAGQQAPRLLEIGGATWAFDEVVENPPGEQLEASFEDEPTLVSFYFSGVPAGRPVRLVRNGHVVARDARPEGGSQGVYLLARGGHLALEVPGGVGPDTRLALVSYTRQAARPGDRP